MSEEPVAEKKKDVPVKARKMSDTINSILGTKLDLTRLSMDDLITVYNLVTDDRKLRRLSIRILRRRLHGIGHQAKAGIKDTIRDIVSESGLGERALKFMSGEDDEEEDELEDA